MFAAGVGAVAVCVAAAGVDAGVGAAAVCVAAAGVDAGAGACCWLSVPAPG